ncbi:MAG TPA: DsrE family protein [Chitinophagaceae bacterium]|nr:DsrE family protein [Chitinophagaceae bacterium]
MKKLFLSFLGLFIALGGIVAQDVPYNVVFDITSGEPAAQQRMITLINEIISVNPDAKVEVVFYGNSIAMVDKSQSQVADDITKLAGQNVQFRACHIAMKKHNVEDSGLVSGVQSVPDGIYEIVKKQAAGYAYIKIVP